MHKSSLPSPAAPQFVRVIATVHPNRSFSSAKMKIVTVIEIVRVRGSGSYISPLSTLCPIDRTIKFQFNDQIFKRRIFLLSFFFFFFFC